MKAGTLSAPTKPRRFGRSGCLSALVLALVLLHGIVPRASANDTGERDIRKLIAELDDERFPVRQRAAAELLEIGEPAVPRLLAAAKGTLPEQRARAVDLVRAIRLRRVTRGFEELGRKQDADIDVEHGMWLIALLLDPEITDRSIDAKLDAMAAAVRAKIGDGVDPKTLAGPEVMAALTGVLKGEFGLHGDEENYDHPDNSSIHRVIEQKDGLPIVLSEIAVAVGRRLEVPVVGLPIPGRYMIKYDGSQAPPGAPVADVIINPYEGWKVTTPAELERTVGFLVPDRHLAAAEPRATLERMLNNMESDFLEQGQPREAATVRVCRSLLMFPRLAE